MHKGIIFLTTAEDEEDAQHIVSTYLNEMEEGELYDWYAVGGRWSSLLAPKEKLDKFNAKLASIEGFAEEGRFHSFYQKHEQLIQEYWQKSNLRGENPHYGGFLGPKKPGYISVPLAECYQVVKEWQQEPKEEAKKLKEEAERWREGYYDRRNNPQAKEYDPNFKPTKKDKEQWAGMARWKLSILKDIEEQKLHTDTNVYNLESCDYAVPDKKDAEGWYAVIIDIHY